MKKILVFGSSHVGALKVGLNNIDKKYLENISFDFAAVPRKNFHQIYLNNNKLNFPQEIIEKYSGVFGNIQFPIDLDKYDYHILVGAEILSPIEQLITSEKKFTYYSKNFIENYIDNFFYLESITNKENKDQIHKLIKLLCSKIIIIPTPLEVLSVKNKSKFDSIPNTKLIAKQINLIRSICDNVSEEKNKVSILLPPEKLLENNQLNTKHNYIRGGLKWNGNGHNRKRDVRHMNPEYGKEIMLSIINKLH